MQRSLKIFSDLFYLKLLKLNRMNFHLTKAFSIPNALSGVPENTGSACLSQDSNSSSASNGITSECEASNCTTQPKIESDWYMKYQPIDIDMDKLDKDTSDDIDCKIEKDDIPVQRRKGIYTSTGIKVFIPEKHMHPGTCRHRIDKLPETIPDDMRVIYYR